MRSVTPMRAAKIGYIVMSSLFCVLGAVLLFTPDASALWIGRLLGIGMIVFGAVKLVGYFSRDLFRLACVIGVVLVFRPAAGVRVLTALMGLSLLSDGALNLSVALCTVKIVDHQRPDVIETDDYEIE